MSLVVPEAFSMVRGLTQHLAAGFPTELADSTPIGCRNTPRWQLGHVITSAEGLLLGFAGEPLVVSEGWQAWFGIGTSPDDFTSATPDWPALLAALAVSSEALVAALPGMDPARRLARPFAPASMPWRLETVGEIVAMATWHESLHLGQIMTYGNLLRAAAGAA